MAEQMSVYSPNSSVASGVYNMSQTPGFINKVSTDQNVWAELQEVFSEAAGWGFGEVYIPLVPGKDILFNDQLLIPVGLSVTMDPQCWLKYTGTQNGDHIVAGDPTLLNVRANLDLRVKRATFSDWSNDADTGIRVHNSYYFSHRLESDGFTNCIWLSSTNHAFAYGQVDLGLTRSGRRHLVLHKANNNAAWMNQITFRGTAGSFNSDSDSRTRCGYTAGVKYPIGVWMYAENNFHPFNALQFENLCFEVSPSVASPWVESACVEIQGDVRDLSFTNARHENNSPVFIRHRSGLLRDVKVEISNLMSEGTQFADMYDSVAGANRFDNVLFTMTQKKSTQPQYSWTSPNFGQTACQYDGAGKIYVPGAFWHSSDSNTRYKQSIGSVNQIDVDAIEIPDTDCISFLIHTGKCRMLTVKPIVREGAEFLRQGFIPWNTDKSLRLAPAFIFPTLTGGVITATTVFTSGKYDTPPTLLVVDANGAPLSATLTPNLDVDGHITSVNIVSGGTGLPAGTRIIVRSNDKHWLQSEAFQETTNWYGSYYDNSASDTGYSLWMRDGVGYVEVKFRATGGSVWLSGLTVTSLDGHPFTMRSWFDGGYGDFHKRFVGAAPTNPWKGYYATDELLLNDAVSASGNPVGYRYRAGDWDTVAV